MSVLPVAAAALKILRTSQEERMSHSIDVGITPYELELANL